MIQFLIPLLASVPFILLLILIIVLKWPAIKAMPLIWLITAIITLTIWQTTAITITASFIKGLFIALEIMLIIFGAIWIISILQEKKQIKNIHNLLAAISPDVRVQALLIAWLFASLIEGIAGFGTPAVLAAPLLVSLGFAPILAVTISLIGHSTAVSFGAAGVPIHLGLGSLGFAPELLKQVTQTTATIHFTISLLIPLIITYFVVSHTSKNKTKDFIATIPFALLAWLSFSLPYFLTAMFIGPELPSILGGIIGLTVVGLAAKYKILTPKKTLSFSGQKEKTSHNFSLKATIPYVLIVLLLSLSRTLPSLKQYLSNVSISYPNILSSPLSYNFLPLFTPSFFFILAAITSLFIFKVTRKETSTTLKKTFNKIKYPTIALIFTLALVQLLIASDINNSSLPAMPIALAQATALIFNKSFLFVSPFIGAFGSFLTGSNTVSNLLFSTFQSETAIKVGLPLFLILSLQVVGGAIGNMIAIHNVLAANATVGLQGKAWKVIRKTIWISLIYALLAGIVGFVMLILFN